MVFTKKIWNSENAISCWRLSRAQRRRALHGRGPLRSLTCGHLSNLAAPHHVGANTREGGRPRRNWWSPTRRNAMDVLCITPTSMEQSSQARQANVKVCRTHGKAGEGSDASLLGCSGSASRPPHASRMHCLAFGNYCNFVGRRLTRGRYPDAVQTRPVGLVETLVARLVA